MNIPPATTRCNRCGAPIRWLTTKAGKKMPVEANKEPRGTVDVVDGLAHVVPPSEEFRYVPHFARCQTAAR